jgi:RNA polymerase sigma-70 factor (ECF subfamily)
MEQLYSRYWKILYLIALKKTGNPEDSEDIVQELFIDVWKNKETWEISTNLRSYLVSCLYLKIFTYFRKKGVRQKHLDDFSKFTDTVTSAHNELSPLIAAMSESEFRQLQEVLTEAVNLMPGQMQKAFILRYQRQASISAIAEELNISPNTVKKHLSEGLKRLRQSALDHSTELNTLLFIFSITHGSR